MKFFNWMQTKLSARPASQKPNTVLKKNQIQQPSQREEFSDWPHELLTIGTFGNNKPQDEAISSEVEKLEQEQNPTSVSSLDELSDFTPEEIGQLQNQLTNLLKRKPVKQVEEDSPDFPLDRFLNCPSSLEVSRRISNEYNEDDIEHTISVIIGKCKEVRAEKKSKNEIGHKSLSFLLKKMFVCANGFSTSPIFRDTLHQTRMEKLLRTILRKKIYPQISRASSLTRYVEDKHSGNERSQNEGCKWDKTDSEYIVLEI